MRSGPIIVPYVVPLLLDDWNGDQHGSIGILYHLVELPFPMRVELGHLPALVIFRESVHGNAGLFLVQLGLVEKGYPRMACAAMEECARLHPQLREADL